MSPARTPVPFAHRAAAPRGGAAATGRVRRRDRFRVEGDRVPPRAAGESRKRILPRSAKGPGDAGRSPALPRGLLVVPIRVDRQVLLAEPVRVPRVARAHSRPQGIIGEKGPDPATPEPAWQEEKELPFGRPFRATAAPLPPGRATACRPVSGGTRARGAPRIGASAFTVSSSAALLTVARRCLGPALSRDAASTSTASRVTASSARSRTTSPATSAKPRGPRRRRARRLLPRTTPTARSAMSGVCEGRMPNSPRSEGTSPRRRRPVHHRPLGVTTVRVSFPPSSQASPAFFICSKRSRTSSIVPG